MSESTIWKGCSSNWKNFKSIAATILLVPVCVWLNVARGFQPWIYILAGVAGLWALWQWLVLRSTVYEVTNERLVSTRGIFTRVTDTLELYRVRDMRMVQPLLLRILKLHNIEIITTDSTTPDAVLDYIPTSAGLGEQFRKTVEACREAKRVRAFDVVSEGTNPHGDDSDGLVS